MINDYIVRPLLVSWHTLQSSAADVAKVTYNFAMYGLILHPKKDDELAHQVTWSRVDACRTPPGSDT